MRILTKKEIAPILLILLMIIFALSLYAAPCVRRVPLHWNAQGEIDAWGNKTFVALFFPLLTMAIYLLMLFLPRIDPLKENYVYFENAYYFIRLALVAFFVALYIFTFFSAAGYHLDIVYFIVPALSVLFIVLGAVLPKIKRNYFVGIRTPWTLHSDIVWIKTHQFGSWCFITAGILGVFALFLDRRKIFPLFLIFVIISVIAPLVYSYLLYRKNNDNNHSNAERDTTRGC